MGPAGESGGDRGGASAHSEGDSTITVADPPTGGETPGGEVPQCAQTGEELQEWLEAIGEKGDRAGAAPAGPPMVVKDRIRQRKDAASRLAPPPGSGPVALDMAAAVVAPHKADRGRRA